MLIPIDNQKMPLMVSVINSFIYFNFMTVFYITKINIMQGLTLKPVKCVTEDKIGMFAACFVNNSYVDLAFHK